MILSRATIATPVGPMLALTSDAALCALEFSSTGRLSRLEARLARWFGGPEIVDASNAIIERTRRWLESYFAGADADARALPLDLRGGTFELKVWAVLLTLRPGEVTSYGAIAKQLGSPGASRAVGLANGANPIAIVVPCHRVIGANGALTGYGGGLDRKRSLLNHERRWRNALPLWLTDDLRSPASANVERNGG
jgi:methylated-DNA-[protein]-cysteine S-methyltransferase